MALSLNGLDALFKVTCPCCLILGQRQPLMERNRQHLPATEAQRAMPGLQQQMYRQGVAGTQDHTPQVYWLPDEVRQPDRWLASCSCAPATQRNAASLCRVPYCSGAALGGMQYKHFCNCQQKPLSCNNTRHLPPVTHTVCLTLIAQVRWQRAVRCACTRSGLAARWPATAKPLPQPSSLRPRPPRRLRRCRCCCRQCFRAATC